VKGHRTSIHLPFHQQSCNHQSFNQRQEEDEFWLTIQLFCQLPSAFIFAALFQAGSFFQEKMPLKKAIIKLIHHSCSQS
ncbi:MAG: hypothetical protein AAB316_13710, partial [Bacteroidota bacterium]